MKAWTTVKVGLGKDLGLGQGHFESEAVFLDEDLFSVPKLALTCRWVILLLVKITRREEGKGQSTHLRRRGR